MKRSAKSKKKTWTKTHPEIAKSAAIKTLSGFHEPVSAVARKYGVSRATIYKWRKTYGANLHNDNKTVVDLPMKKVNIKDIYGLPKHHEYPVDDGYIGLSRPKVEPRDEALEPRDEVHSTLKKRVEELENLIRAKDYSISDYKASNQLFRENSERWQRDKEKAEKTAKKLRRKYDALCSTVVRMAAKF